MEMGPLLVPTLFSLFVCFVISIYFLPSLFKSRKHGSQSLKTPPGTTGLPLIGETLDFVSYGRKGVAERFALDRMEKYSSMVVRTRLFGEPMAVLCGPEANKFIYSNENKLVKAWRPRVIHKLFGDVEATEMRRRKLYTTHYLSPDALQKYVPIMDSATKQYMKTYWEGRETVTAHPLTELYTLTLTTRLFMRIDDRETVESLHKPFRDLLKGIHSLPLNIPGTAFYAALRARKKIHECFNEWVKKWKNDFSEGKLSAEQLSLADILNQTFQEDDIADIIMSLIAGAFDTTSATLSSIIMNLARYPQAYHKVLAEQRQIAKSKEGKALNWGDIQKMKYSWNVACESLRLYSGDAVFKEAITDITYEGFLIPKGWKVFSSQSATHRCSKYFTNPEKFDPSRFEGDGVMPYTFVPFSGGPRMCPGKEYARTKILVFMHNLVTRFKWEQIFPDERMATNPVAKPTNSLPIRLYPHKP